MRLLLFITFLFYCILSCRSSDTTDDVISAPEVKIKYLPLNGPAANSNAEMSGLAWFGDWLIVLPQYPHRFSSKLFYIEKEEILRSIGQNNPEPIKPGTIDLLGGKKLMSMDGFQGFEALCFSDRNVFFTVEMNYGDFCNALMVKGTISAKEKTIYLNEQKMVSIESQSNLKNFSEEALLFVSDNLLTIHEANGKLVNSSPQAHLFKTDLTPMPPFSVSNIEFRITDATAIDTYNRFWVINYLWSGDLKKFGNPVDPLFKKYGIGKSHASSNTVERLLELEMTSNGIDLSNSAPILLELDSKGASRNWEGLVRLDNKGFLMITDKHPATIFGFLPINPNKY